MKKRQLITILSLSLILIFSTLSVNGFEGGDGSSSNPYQISDCNQLQDVNNNLSVNYELINNIDCSNTKDWNNGKGFKPIGNIFSGNFYGNGFVITDLYINRTSGTQHGLFSSIGSEVKNLGVTNANITGGEEVGILVGSNDGKIINSYVSGNVSGSPGLISGLAGSNYGDIINSYSNASIHSDYGNNGGLVAENQGYIANSHSNSHVSAQGDNIGGLVGTNRQTINNSYSESNVSGNYDVGGLVGSNRGDIINSYSNSNALGSDNRIGGLVGHNYGSISKSYSNGKASGNDVIGGLVGWNDGGTITNSFSNTYIDSGGSYLGGLNAYNEGSISNSFWNIDTSGQSSSDGGTGKTNSEMSDVSTFTDTSTTGLSNAWDFFNNPNDDTSNDDFWYMSGKGYPGLVAFNRSVVLPSVSNFSGSETTNFTSIDDLSSVVNMTLATTNTKVKWDNIVNAKGQDFDKNTNLDNGLVSINTTSLDPSINGSATISLNVGSCSDIEVYYYRGVADSLSELKDKGSVIGDETGCTTSYCGNLSCSSGELTYDVTHFSSTGADSTSTDSTETVPEFSTYTLLLAVAITILGFYTIRK